MNTIGVKIDTVSYQSATNQAVNWATQCSSRYICVANVHTVMEAWDSKPFHETINNADLVTPDGMPLVWLLRLKGHRDQERVYGPTLMLHVLENAAQAGISVGFYGSTQQVLDQLKAHIQTNFANIKISYSFSPPFRDITPAEDEQISNAISLSKTQILFVGLGCPKQETWMATHRGRIPAVMIGVGAAFDFHARIKPQAPQWLQSIGLEWLFRFLTEPRRLWRRYLKHNSRFIFLAIADLLGLIR